MEPTHLVYLEDMQRLEDEAAVVAVQPADDRTSVILDRTILYPQGGGQPYDQGVISKVDARFAVEEVRFIDGAVWHIGRFESGSLAPGDAVRLEVDGERRALNARLHSAGHVVDMAVSARNLGWVPGKGYHFPQGPYVEYEGSLEGVEPAELVREVEARANEIVGQGIETMTRFMSRDELASVCSFVPDYVPADKPSRVVFYGDFGVPCGGTHVANLRDIGRITIRKIKKAKGSAGTVRVSYEL